MGRIEKLEVGEDTGVFVYKDRVTWRYFDDLAGAMCWPSSIIPGLHFMILGRERSVEPGPGRCVVLEDYWVDRHPGAFHSILTVGENAGVERWYGNSGSGGLVKELGRYNDRRRASEAEPLEIVEPFDLDSVDEYQRRLAEVMDLAKPGRNRLEIEVAQITRSQLSEYGIRRPMPRPMSGREAADLEPAVAVLVYALAGLQRGKELSAKGRGRKVEKPEAKAKKTDEQQAGLLGAV